ncbi:hypothetical protein [Maribellus maritimus]|uniref:hypothetical protein n=1 Tax=Maribellus maritimus TaxID=2870838 RepID=UPI001EEC95E0|nr:hypothetical protein [Maribellus maritimus]MCG6186330.1 hypothetical protein [Maribellus maritimus]
MSKNERFPKWMYIILPALAMMLGWGLRGHIGGGPFGAMIPGAMVALSIGLLLELPAAATSVLLVFAVFGIGIGGEMTYGQTLGFLRSPDTVMWGTAGTTLKGAMWGLLGGAVLALGFVYKEISKKRIIVALLLVILGMFLGFKLINDPMILYFSDPEKPRAESWAGLLFGAIFLLIYLKLKIQASSFKIIFRFALWGMIGGALGFGLGGLWLYLGSRLPGVVFTSWWKAMEFSFGLLLGAFLGYAAWLSRGEVILKGLKEKEPNEKKFPAWKEISIGLGTGLFIFWLLPNTIEWLGNTSIVNNMTGGTISAEIARIADNYTVTGLIFVLVLMRFPKAAWQIGITLTFCHTAIDLFRDFYPDINPWLPFNLRFFYIFIFTMAVALLTHFFSKRKMVIVNLFYLLIWSCISISFLRMFVDSAKLDIEGLTFCQVVCGKYIVDIFFAASAIALTWVLKKKIKFGTN